MQKIGPQFSKLAEISLFLCLGPAIGQFSKNVRISANFWNRSPIFCMKGQFCMYYIKSLATMGQKSLFKNNIFFSRRKNIINLPYRWDRQQKFCFTFKVCQLRYFWPILFQFSLPVTPVRPI